MRFTPFSPRVQSRIPVLLAPFVGLALTVGSAGCLFHHSVNTNPLASLQSHQPDKVLYDTAIQDLDKAKFTVARLNLETLMNTYPDSEYLARAKMAIADSWYRQGGADGLAQAEAQYKDFITFFPAVKEAAEAQLKIATIHYDQLEKPDRDPTQAREAQSALRTFLVTYPTSSLRPQALQMLRNTQEVLADRLYLIADFYLQRAKNGAYNDYRPAQGRLAQLLTEYPLYSQGDLALSQLAHSFLVTSQRYQAAVAFQSNPQEKKLYSANASTDRAHAVADFKYLIERYPLSTYASDAAAQLKSLKITPPKPTEQALAFNRKEIAGRGKAEQSEGFLSHMGFNGLLSTHPLTQIARADKVGEPPLSQAALPPEPPPPGLEELLRQSMIASGAIPANSTGPLPLANAALSAQLQAANSTLTAPGQSVAEAEANSSSDQLASLRPDPAAAVGALAFQDISQRPQGMGAPINDDAPQAITGSNNDDPNARQATASDDPNVVLTPNEIDMENRDQILAAEVHRSVPPPKDELAKFEREIRKRNQSARKGHVPPVPGAAPKKSVFSRLWP